MNKPAILLVSGVIIIASAAGGWWFAKQRGTESHRHQLVRETAPDGEVYYSCPMHPEVHQAHPGNCPICGMPLVQRHATSVGGEPGMHEDDGMPPPPASPAAETRRLLYWYDPMKPEQHFDKPGKSPFMDMELVPKYAGEASSAGDAAIVSIDPRMAQNLGMRTAAVRRGPSSSRIVASGSVVVDERRIVVVESRASGWVEQLKVRAVGDSVRRGEVLAAVYAPEFLAAQEELRVAGKLGDPTLVDAARTRLNLLGVAAGSAVRRSVAITAPTAGVVTELLAREGAQVSPGMPLMKLADLSKVWIVADLPEAQSAGVHPGMPAQATLRALPGRTFDGSVDYVYPSLDAQTRTLRVRLAFDNTDGALKPGQYAEVALAGSGAQDSMLAPTEAVIRTGTRDVVIVAEGAGRYRPVEVTLGAEQGDETIVLAGLEAGQQLVTSGQFLIDSEASLQGAYNRMTGAPGHGS